MLDGEARRGQGTRQGDDYYDLTYVLLNNRAGGPREAGERLATGQFADDIRARLSLFRGIEARFSTAQDTGPSGYVSQTLQIHPRRTQRSCVKTPSAP